MPQIPAAKAASSTEKSRGATQLPARATYRRLAARSRIPTGAGGGAASLVDVALWRDGAGDVLRSQHPVAGAAFFEDRGRRTIGGAEGDKQEADGRHGAQPAEDGLAGHVDDIHEARGDRIPRGRLH